MHTSASTICLVIAIVCEVIAAIPPYNSRVNFMPLGFAFALLSLIVGRI